MGTAPNVAYPNGRCPGCGFGLNDDKICTNRDCPQNQHPVDLHIAKICDEAGLNVMVQVYEVLLDREDVVDEAKVLALTADDVNDHYVWVAKGIDQIERVLAGETL